MMNCRIFRPPQCLCTIGPEDPLGQGPCDRKQLLPQGSNAADPRALGLEHRMPQYLPPPPPPP
eukprot:2566184-Pyramimonas_sp.AAC.2